MLGAFGELDPVLGAGLPAVRDKGGGLADGERQAVQVLGQVERLDSLAGIVVQPRVELDVRIGTLVQLVTK